MAYRFYVVSPLHRQRFTAVQQCIFENKEKSDRI
ncbi:unnamed protein product [Ascophyllum nodosum]